MRAHLVAVLDRVVYLAKLRTSALAMYDQGDTPDRLRASVVAASVAGDLGIENSPAFRGDLTKALRSVGWRSVKRDNVRLWKGVRRK